MPLSKATVTPKVTMTLISPAKGELITLEEVNDPSFSSKKAGNPLIQFDCQAIENAGYDLTTPFIILNSDEFSLNINQQESNQVQFGQPLIQLTQ
ncbi:hypothetical protein ACXHPU_00650 [Vibrio cincinnatiensis]